MTSLDRQVLDAIRRVVTANSAGLHEPTFDGNERAYVDECLVGGWVSSGGPFVDRFERQLEETTGARHAIATSSGTAALHVALQLAGVRSGDEVLLPALSFVATANAVSYLGATPHFIDSEFDTLGVGANCLRAHLAAVAERRAGGIVNRETGRRISAVVPMHTFGHPVDMAGITVVAEDFGVAVVEDAAESIGSFVGGVHTGTMSRSAAVSFNGNKTITTGGGGAILVGDDELARVGRHLTMTAKVRHKWEFRHDQVGYNYRMPSINAALGCAQLERLPALVERQRRLFDLYSAAFDGIEGVRLVREPPGCRSNYWLQTLLLDSDRSKERDAILRTTNQSGFATRPAWSLLPQQVPYQSCPRAPLPVASELVRRIINLPSSATLV